MPDTLPPVPDVTAPKKPRKGRKAKTPPVERAPRKPSLTLLARIKAMGEYHVAAYRILANEAFTAALRSEWSHTTRLASAKARAERLRVELASAEGVYDRVADERWADGYAGKTLDELAHHIAEARGDMIETDDADSDTTFDGSGTPRDTAPPRHEDE